MTRQRIWTVTDCRAALRAAMNQGDKAAWGELIDHNPHADHCDGYEVAFWPCPTAAALLDRLLSDSTAPTEDHP